MSKGMREKLVMIQGEYELAGTMTLPETEARNRVPAILILPGTGGSDRDGNRGGLDMNIYKELAEYLTCLGFATLRFDKRGSFESKGDVWKRGMWDLVDDAVACLRFLKQQPAVDSEQVIILGHSEGAILGPAAYAKEPVAGMMLLGGGAMCLRDVMVWQRRQAYDALERAGGFKGWLVRKLNVAVKSEKKVEKFEKKVTETNKDYIRLMGKKFPAKWMREHYDYDAGIDMARVECPVLLAIGDKDAQAPLISLERAAELAQGEAELHVIPNMTHILKRWDDQFDAAGMIKIYKQQAQQPLQQELLDVLEQWLAKHFKQEKPAQQAN
ncbi:alpha/beta hydrolase [Ectobacillus ponti]|uniref:Lysophospholipase n=1 Tax=Ectobacillus ponti TaxID=2961894 RepID=A0AA42BRT9_9BACI|nr:alpha/beta fold hydrolase [Ectobacillus ponti]MCP8969864.1 lysophospholipase [Ectobacillus ponti]